jgi:AraC-like DNA-binding protein
MRLYRNVLGQELLKCDMSKLPMRASSHVRANVLAAVIEGTALITRPPVSELERFSGCFFSLSYKPGVQVQTLPDPSAHLVIEIPDAKPPRCLIAGPRLKSARSAPMEPMHVVGIRLRPGVAFLLTGIGADRWAGRREPLADFLGPCARELAEKIAAAESTDSKFDLLESFLVERLAGKQMDQRVSMALRLIQGSAGAMLIKDVACRCGLSCRQLERLLRLWVGILPKRLARIARFQAALVCAGKQPASEWTYVAAEQNYVDQAHLIHEFSGFTGASPTRFASFTSAGNLKANCD